MVDGETHYTKAKKFALNLVIATKNLRPCFQAYMIIVLIDEPLKNILQKLNASRRLINWSIELSELDIWYKSRKGLKAPFWYSAFDKTK